MLRVKTRYWWILREFRLLALWFLGEFPGETGAWLRSRCLRPFLKALGTDTLIQHGFRVTSPEMISIGAHCIFGQGTFITGGGGVRIGDWVGFGPDVKVWSVTHRFRDPSQPWQLQGSKLEEVVIEDDVWLAANTFVMPGVRIGRGAIVSACSVVTKSVPPYAIFAGNPGRVIGWRKAPEADDSGQVTVATQMQNTTQPQVPS